MNKVSISRKEHGSVPYPSAVAVVVETQDPRLLKESGLLQTKLGTQQGDPALIVYFGQNGVDIRSVVSPDKKGYQVDFTSIDRRKGAGNLSRKQVFPKAIGASTETVIDATAGLGVDSAMLALMGYTVTAIEKSPVLSVLLRDGAHRASQDSELCDALGGRLVFLESDSLVTLRDIRAVDAVYLDPMFPPKRKKSALPQGSIQMLQHLVGYDKKEQVDKLFDAAMQVATKRVVVKRPNYAPFFSEQPTVVHRGKLVRYEVYTPKQEG